MIETEDIRLSQERLAALKELITPIKDLAKNWDIDLNLELEKYMSSFEGDAVQEDNFAEAALVIQGSAGVWGKKVEFLHSLVLNSVNMLEEQEKVMKKKKKGGGEEEEPEEESGMMTLGHVNIKQANNIFIDLHTIISRNCFKPRLPLYLSAISIKSSKPEHMLYNIKGELLAGRADFAVNNCIIGRSGFASLDIHTCLQVNKSKKTANTPFFKRRVSHYEGFVQPGIRDSDNLAASNTTVVPEIPGEDLPEEAMDAMDVMDEDDDDEVSVGALDLEVPEDKLPEPSTPVPHVISKREVHNQSVNSSIKLPANKMNKKLSLHEEVPCKPFKKGIIEEPKTGKRRISKRPKTTLTDFLAANSTKKEPRFPNILRKPVCPENTELFKNLNKKESRKKNHLKKIVQKMQCESKNPITIPKDFFTVAAQADSDSDPGAGGDNDDACGTIIEATGPLEVPNLNEDDFNTSHLHALEYQQNQKLNQSDKPAEPSYEDMVREHVDKFTSAARDHFRVSELRGRVLDWETKISPILEREEETSPYDVCHYSTKFLDKLAACPNSSADINQILSGEGRGEVCRLFLTSLMLTNSGNIEMENNEQVTNCKLISRKLFSDVLEGYIVSEEPPTSKGNKKKRKTPPS